MKKLIFISIILLVVGCNITQEEKDKAIETTKALQNANRISAPINPLFPAIDIGTEIILGLLGASGVAGTVAYKKIKSGNVYQAKYESHKEAVETYSRAHPEVSDGLYEQIGKAREKIMTKRISTV